MRYPAAKCGADTAGSRRRSRSKTTRGPAGDAGSLRWRVGYGSAVLPAAFGATVPSRAFSDCARSSNSAA